MIEGALTEAQEGLWLARRLDPTSPSQNTGQILRLRGALETRRLRDVVQRVVDECDAFRTQVVPNGGRPRITGDVPPILVAVEDVSGAPDPSRRARAAIQADVERPRDPACDAMVTATIFRLAAEEHWWYLCAQHLVIDGFGTSLLNVRVLDVLGAELDDRPPRTRPFPSFQAVVEEDARYRASPKRSEDRAFWAGELGEVADAPSLVEGEPLASDFHHRARATLPAELVAGMKALARSAGTSWPDVAVAGVALYVKRHTGSDDVVLGVPVMNRLGTAAARVPCTAMNVMPIRIHVEEELDALGLVRRVADTVRRSRAHGRYRSEELRRERGALGEGRRLFGPLVNVLPFQPLPTLSAVSAELEVLGAGPVDDLTITFRGGGVGSAVALEMDSNPALYSLDGTIEHRDRLLAFLDAFCASAGAIAGVPTMTPDEQRRWVHDVNDTAHPVPESTLVDRIEARARRTPDAPALVSTDVRLTYAQLLDRTRAVATRLRAHGVGRGDVVAVLMPRSADQVVAFLASMWAGAAYLPLDPEHPDARLAQIVEGASPRAVLADAGQRERLEASAWIDGSSVIDVAAESSVRGTGTPLDRPAPTDAAYVIYTSGSTGEPKGVVVEHRAIVNRLEWMRATFDVGGDDTVLYKTPATFDVSVWELFLPFLSGARMVVAHPGAQRDPGALGRLVREHGVTAMHFVPSMLGPFLEHPDNDRIEIPRLFCSGEALTPSLRARFHQRVRGALHNLYGPTEAAVDVSHWPAGPEDRSDPVPIGRPVWNTRLYVLDAEGRPLPPDVLGELHIAGRQLARGYLGRKELTDERFVEDPFVRGARMYRTGDLARWRRDGALVFAGRTDHQVKIRGQRIELGEVESVLGALPGVGQAVAVVREGPRGGPMLVGYVAAPGRRHTPEALRDAVAQRLPDAMVPRVVVVLDALPLTSSGKIDRRRLPEPPAAVVKDTSDPHTGTERAVGDIYRSVLDLGALPGPSDDFFALGGQSLSAIEVLAAVRERFGADLGPGTLFSAPTVARLARAIDEHGGPGAADVASAEEVRGLGPTVVLSEGSAHRAPLYCIHPAGGISWSYGPLARALAPRGVVGVQASGLHARRPLPASLDAMAADYVGLVLERGAPGPVHLLGWSVGGIVAHAMAVQLLEAGVSLGAVVLLDAYPADRFRQEPEPDEAAPLRAMLLIAGEDPEGIQASELTREVVRARLRSAGHVLGTLSDEALDGVVRVVGANNRLVREHRHQPLEHDVIHFRAGLDHQGSDLDARLWAPYVSGIESHVIPALHAHMTGPTAAGRIATILRQRVTARDRP